MNKVTSAIRKITKRYKDRDGVSPRQISEGMCEQFAEDTLELVGNDDVLMNDNASEDFNRCPRYPTLNILSLH